MLSYDQAGAKKQWREAVTAVAEAIEDAARVANNVNDAKLDALTLREPHIVNWGSNSDGLLLARRDRPSRVARSDDDTIRRIKPVREAVKESRVKLGCSPARLRSWPPKWPTTQPPPPPQPRSSDH